MTDVKKVYYRSAKEGRSKERLWLEEKEGG